LNAAAAAVAVKNAAALAALHLPGFRENLAGIGNHFSGSADSSGSNAGAHERLIAFGTTAPAHGPFHPFADGMFRVAPPADQPEKKADNDQRQDQIHERFADRPSESTTTREAGGLNFLAAALAAGKKRQKHFCASMLNLQ
jgi:hypothetical protein